MALGLIVKGVQLALKGYKAAKAADKAGALTTLGATVAGGAGAIAANKTGRDKRKGAQKQRDKRKKKGKMK